MKGGSNFYAYVNSQPVLLIDPHGLMSTDSKCKLIAGAVFVGSSVVCMSVAPGELGVAICIIGGGLAGAGAYGMCMPPGPDPDDDDPGSPKSCPAR